MFINTSLRCNNEHLTSFQGVLYLCVYINDQSPSSVINFEKKQKRQNLDNFIRATIHFSWKPISSSWVSLLAPILPWHLACIPSVFSPTSTSSLETVPNGQSQGGLLTDRNYRLWVKCPFFAPFRTHGFGQGVVQSTRFQRKTTISVSMKTKKYLNYFYYYIIKENFKCFCFALMPLSIPPFCLYFIPLISTDK